MAYDPVTGRDEDDFPTPRQGGFVGGMVRVAPEEALYVEGICHSSAAASWSPDGFYKDGAVFHEKHLIEV